MASILEFFEMYGTWIIAGAVIILLAIIGRYADKTNFGQNKKNEKTNDKDKKSELEIKPILNEQKLQQKDKLPEIKDTLLNKEQLINEEDKKILEPINKKDEEESKTLETNKNDNPEIVKEPTTVEKNIPDLEKVTFDEQYKRLDEEIDTLLPKKEIIEEDLLEDIDNLSLDRTQKIKITDIPDLDDVDLPEIKKLNQHDNDIWKF